MIYNKLKEPRDKTNINHILILGFVLALFSQNVSVC